LYVNINLGQYWEGGVLYLNLPEKFENGIMNGECEGVYVDPKRMLQ